MPTLLYIPRFDESGASPRYRVYQYLDGLKQIGFDITVKPLLDIKYLNNFYFNGKRSKLYLLKKYFQRAYFLLFNKSKFDVVLMDGELFPYLPFFLEKIFLPPQYIIDQDDAIFHTYDEHKSLFVRTVFGKKINKIWKNSRHIIVGNSYVKEKALLTGAKRVTALPTVVNADIYKPFPVKPRQALTEIIIGWVGSPTTIWLMDHISQALVNVAKKTNIVLYIIGANYSIDGIKTICVDWKEGWSEEKEIELTNEIDIGIMPLVDGPYQKGKCGFKLIKYMACAIPMIASAVGMNPEIVDHGKNGYLASTTDEWEKYLLILINDANKRKEFGQNGREKMLEQYSLQATQPVMHNILLESYNKTTATVQ